MTVQPTHRGAAPVGYVQDLPAVERSAVLYLRLWGDGPDAQGRVWSAFAAALGPEAGRPALKSLEELFALCQRHARRPLCRHATTCKCLGADESCFATLIGYASEGAREDAFLMATTLVRPDMAHMVANLAEELGLALRRMACQPRPARTITACGQTLH